MMKLILAFIFSLTLLSACKPKTEVILSTCLDYNKKPSEANSVDKYPIDNHFDHIRKIQIARNKHTFHGDSCLVDFVKNKYLKDKQHSIHLTDRSYLNKIPTSHCIDNDFFISSTLSNGSKFEIRIKRKELNLNDLQVEYRDDDSITISQINNKTPFGNFYGSRRFDAITELSIKIDNNNANYTTNELPNLFEPSFCDFDSFSRPIEVYENQNFIYVYVYGGNAANTYMAKLIFDQTNYITDIIVDYVPLSSFGSFHSQFIGF